MKLTILTTMKPMLPEFIEEQTNALLSWQHLKIKPEIIVFGDDQGVPEFCKAHSIKNVPVIKKNIKGIPLMNDIVNQGYTYCEDEQYVAYINADIVLLDDFCDTLAVFDKQYPNIKSCLLTAIRYNITNFKSLDFNKNWRKKIDRFDGHWSLPNGVDLFVHKKGNFKDMPNFAIARFFFDSWMLDHAIKNFDMCVNMTATMKMYHHFGYWYQNDKVVIRDWSWSPNVVDYSSAMENKSKTNELKYTRIDQCPYVSKFVNGEIIISK
jgi:hypothetical protein